MYTAALLVDSRTTTTLTYAVFLKTESSRLRTVTTGNLSETTEKE